MVVLTFDIEEWFHIIDHDSTRTEKQWLGFESRIHRNVDRILDLLDSYNQKATFFCLGWIAKKYPEVVLKIHNGGHEIGSHSMSHEMVHMQDRNVFYDDTKKSLDCIEDVIGRKVTLYRAPGFSITPEIPWAFDVLNELGIEIDCSVFPAKHQHGGFPDLNLRNPFLIHRNSYQIKELPMTFLDLKFFKLVSTGGGYFRLLPWSIISASCKSSSYAMTYFHPRDFDDDQPRLSGLNKIRHFKTYVGLSGALAKLSNLLGSYECTNVATAASRIDWSNAAILNM